MYVFRSIFFFLMWHFIKFSDFSSEEITFFIIKSSMYKKYFVECVLCNERALKKLQNSVKIQSKILVSKNSIRK